MPSLPERILDGAQDAIVFADRDGIIQLWNAGAQRMLGHTADEAIGQSLDLIIPERHRERHWAGYRRVMATGETAYADSLLGVPALRADGSRLAVEFTVTLVWNDEDGSVEGIAAIMRDVSERRAGERAVREELAALRERVGDPG